MYRCYSSLDVFYLAFIAGLCLWLLVGIADGNDVVQLIVLWDVKTVKEELGFRIGLDKTYWTA